MEHHCILLVSVLTTHQLSEPYSRTDFTLLSKRSRFVLRLYCFDLQMGQSWEKAPLAFPSIALMYFDAPLSLLMRLPREVKSSINSSGSSLTRIAAVGIELTHITCVLEVWTLSPTCLAKLLSVCVCVYGFLKHQKGSYLSLWFGLYFHFQHESASCQNRYFKYEFIGFWPACCTGCLI